MTCSLHLHCHLVQIFILCYLDYCFLFLLTPKMSLIPLSMQLIFDSQLFTSSTCYPWLSNSQGGCIIEFLVLKTVSGHGAYANIFV